jgi:CcmD family protein
MSIAAKIDQPATETAADRRSEFVPVGAGGETSSAEALLITAYIVMWALIFGLVFGSQRKQRKLEQRLAELESSLAKLDRAAESAIGKEPV